MRKLLLPAILLLAVCSCSKEEVTPLPDESEQMVTVAQKLFSACRPTLTKADCDDGVFSFTPGESDVEWSSSEYYENTANGFEGIESKLESTYEFRAIMPDGNIVWCDRELMYQKNVQTGAESIYMVYYLPTPDYLNSCNGDLASMFNNSGDMGDYTGFKFYNTLDGATVRINEYCDGQCIGGLYLHDQKTDDEVAAAYATLISMLGGVTLQKVIVQEETKAFQMAVDEVEDLYFETMLHPDGTYHFPLGDESTVSAERDYGGGGGAAADESLWWMLYCLQKDGENGNNIDPGDSDKHFGGGGASNDDSYDDGKEEDKEGLDEVKARLSSLVINTSSWENTTETFIATVDSLIKLAATNKALAEALRATKGLSKISIDDCSLTPLTHRDKNTHLPLYISYPGDQFDTPNIMFKVLEEIFHYGQQITYEGWKDGDLELEAKVFVCQIWLQAGGDEGNYPYHGNKYPDQYIANTILGFYAGSVSFSQIKSVLEDIGYQESDFPFSETAAKDRFKHINKFSKNSEFAK